MTEQDHHDVVLEATKRAENRERIANNELCANWESMKPRPLYITVPNKHRNLRLLRKS